MLRKIVVFILALSFMVSAAGCGKGNVSESTVSEEVDASKYEYKEGASIILTDGEEETDLSEYAKLVNDDYMFNADILEAEIGLTEAKDDTGYKRYNDDKGNKLLFTAGERNIFLNNTAVGLAADIYEDEDKNIYLPKDFFLALPGVTGVNCRRDKDTLYISLYKE